MSVNIVEINQSNVGDVNTCDGEFVIDSKLVLHAEDDEISYTVTEIPRFKKRYEEDDVDYTAYIDTPDKTVFLAYVEDRVAGQIILRRNWNRYAYVEDIAVDVDFRKQGIGRALILQAKRWAHERDLAGIMLETQNTNVRACQFYESCGFHLGGFDTYLYKGVKSGTDEIALYWYLVFEDDTSC